MQTGHQAGRAPAGEPAGNCLCRVQEREVTLGRRARSTGFSPAHSTSSPRNPPRRNRPTRWVAILGEWGPRPIVDPTQPSAPSAAPLLFVYNDDSGLLPAIRSVFHKGLAPASYPCSLCALTYGLTRKRRRWREFVGQLDPAPRFLHRDEFLREAPGRMSDQPLPAVFREEPGAGWRLLLSARELDALGSLEELVRAVDQARREEATPHPGG